MVWNVQLLSVVAASLLIWNSFCITLGDDVLHEGGVLMAVLGVFLHTLAFLIDAVPVTCYLVIVVCSLARVGAFHSVPLRSDEFPLPFSLGILYRLEIVMFTFLIFSPRSPAQTFLRLERD